MKKHIKKIIIFAIMAALVIGYYLYLANRKVDTEPVAKDANTKEVEDLTALRIEDNYPDTPRECVLLYCRIMKAYYRTSLTDSQIEKLGRQALLLFGDDLLKNNPEDIFIPELKKDIKNWKDKKSYISDYNVERNVDIDYVTYAGGKQAAIITVMVYVRSGSELLPVSMDFMVGKNDSGKWKILTWSNSKNNQEVTESNGQ